MLRELFGLGREKRFIEHVLGQFRGMMNDTETMFVEALGGLFAKIEEPGLSDKIYEIDRRVNAAQKDIRKRVIEHLTLQPREDTATCLIMMSVVKDAERLGDFAKNLMEIRYLMGGPVDRSEYRALFKGIDDDIAGLFNRTREAFLECDEVLAKGTWEHQRKIKARCSEILAKVSKSDFPANKAVSYALIARYFKRITSHLTNIATSVIVPLDRIDYFES
jgi:phosphate uptake regulator